jgi:hypothetical protein
MRPKRLASMPGRTRWASSHGPFSSTCRKRAGRPTGIGIGAGQAIAGVVDQDVGGAAVRGQVVEDAAGRLGIGEIGLDGQGLDARWRRRISSASRLQPVASAARSGPGRSRGRRDARERRADPAEAPVTSASLRSICLPLGSQHETKGEDHAASFKRKPWQQAGDCMAPGKGVSRPPHDGIGPPMGTHETFPEMTMADPAGAPKRRRSCECQPVA